MHFKLLGTIHDAKIKLKEIIEFGTDAAFSSNEENGEKKRKKRPVIRFFEEESDKENKRRKRILSSSPPQSSQPQSFPTAISKIRLPQRTSLHLPPPPESSFSPSLQPPPQISSGTSGTRSSFQLSLNACPSPPRPLPSASSITMSPHRPFQPANTSSGPSESPHRPSLDLPPPSLENLSSTFTSTPLISKNPTVEKSTLERNELKSEINIWVIFVSSCH